MTGNAKPGTGSYGLLVRNLRLAAEKKPRGVKANVEAACKVLEAEADDWRAEHGDSEEADYASGLLSAVHDIRLALLGEKP